MNEKKFKSNIEGLSSSDYYAISKLENEYRINRLSGIFAVGTQIGVILVLLLNVLNIFVLDTSAVAKLVLLLLPLTASIFVVSYVFKINKTWVKYFITAIECIIVNVLFIYLSMHAVLFFVFPIIKSCLYFSKKHFYITFIISSVIILISHLLSVEYSLSFDDPMTESIYFALVYGFIPRYLEFAGLSAILLLITNKASKMMNSGYKYANTAEKLLEEQKQTHYEIVKNLATMAENKSQENGEHIARVFEYMFILAKKFGYSDDDSYNIALASMLHDVGKLGVDEKILSKPGKLTDEEFAIVKGHIKYGESILSNSNNRVLNMAKKIALNHHERWDGRGYQGLKGEEIDRYSCMMSVIDVFDALTSKRCYKEAWTIQAAYDEIIKGRGTQFSPEVIDVFISCFNEITKSYEKLNPSYQSFASN